MRQPRHATHRPASHHEDGILCRDAVLHRHGANLTIRWNSGAVLDVPVAWCRNIRADHTDDGAQVVLRFTPPQPPDQPHDGTSVISVCLRTDRNDSFRAREFVELLGRELGLPREPEQGSPYEPGQGPPDPPMPHMCSYRLPQIPQSHPDWLVSRPGEATRALYDAVLQRSAETAGTEDETTKRRGQNQG